MCAADAVPSEKGLAEGFSQPEMSYLLHLCFAWACTRSQSSFSLFAQPQILCSWDGWDHWGEILSIHWTCSLECFSSFCQAFIFTLLSQNWKPVSSLLCTDLLFPFFSFYKRVISNACICSACVIKWVYPYIFVSAPGCYYKQDVPRLTGTGWDETFCQGCNVIRAEEGLIWWFSVLAGKRHGSQFYSPLVRSARRNIWKDFGVWVSASVAACRWTCTLASLSSVPLCSMTPSSSWRRIAGVMMITSGGSHFFLPAAFRCCCGSHRAYSSVNYAGW